MELNKQIEELGRAFEEFKATHAKSIKEQTDAVLKASMEKSATEVTRLYSEIQTKLDATTKSLAQRMDEFEAKLARPSQGSEDSKEDQALVKGMTLLKRARRGDQSAVATIEESKAYRDAFIEGYLRRGTPMMEKLTPEMQRAMSVGSDPDGGYWVEPTMSGRIVEKIFETSPMRSLATIETVSGDELKLPYDADEYAVSTASETGTRSETNTSQIGEYIIPVHEMYAKPKATQKLVEDSAFNIQGYVTRKVGDKMTRTEATWFISGSGSGQARGILSYPSGTNWLQVQQVNSGSASDFTYNGLIDIVASLKEPYHANARFLLKRASIANIMKLQDGDGRYIFQPTSVLGFNGQPLLGYPLSFADDIPAVSAGALSLAFGDFRAAYTIADRLGMVMLVDPYSSKPYIEYYTRRRVGGAVVNFEAYKIQKIAA